MNKNRHNSFIKKGKQGKKSDLTVDYFENQKIICEMNKNKGK